MEHRKNTWTLQKDVKKSSVINSLQYPKHLIGNETINT